MGVPGVLDGANGEYIVSAKGEGNQQALDVQRWWRRDYWNENPASNETLNSCVPMARRFISYVRAWNYNGFNRISIWT